LFPHTRLLESRDSEVILEIQSACPEIAQWTLWDYERVARGEMCGWVAEVGGEVTGFLIARRVASELEILNFAVRPSMRRMGIGLALLNAACKWGESFGAQKGFLEVRASNRSALSFYRRFNFRESGRRQGYYASPVEDALLLEMDFHQTHDA